jgi:ABC-2 type transport system ATP-binding protein
MAETAIRTESLSMRYGKKWALTGLDLEVLQGEIFGFLGPNGAGKTTTIKLLTGLLRASGGSASIFGQATRAAASHRFFGYAPENPYLYDFLTPQELLAFYCRLQSLPSAVHEEEITRVLWATGLVDVRHQKVKTFSKGMKGRLALAQALLGSPPIIFLDEPTSGQDPLARVAIRDIMLRHREWGGTVFLNSHILTDVERVCDRVAIINRGKLVSLGAVAEMERGGDRLYVEAAGIEGSVLAGLDRAGKHWEKVEGGIFIDGVGREEVPELTRLLVENGARIYALQPQKRSLEDYFIEVVKDDERPYAGA